MNEQGFYEEGKDILIFDKISRNARLIAYQNESGEKLLQKTLIPWYFEKLSFDQRIEEARKVNKITKYFREGLMNHSFPVIPKYEFYITEQGFPVHIMDYVGDDLAKIIIQNDESKEAHVITEKLISAIKGIFWQKEPWIYAPDLKVNNFCFNDQGEIIFVDIYPPYCILPNGEFFVFHPNPTDENLIEEEKKRKFTLLGAIRRMRFFYLKLTNDYLEETFEKCLYRNLPSHLVSEAMKTIEDLPDKIILNLKGKRLKHYILDLPSNEDTIREVAARLIPRSNKSRLELLRQIFGFSSKFADSEFIGEREQRFNKAKELLLKTMNL